MAAAETATAMTIPTPAETAVVRVPVSAEARITLAMQEASAEAGAVGPADFSVDLAAATVDLAAAAVAAVPEATAEMVAPEGLQGRLAALVARRKPPFPAVAAAERR